MSDAVGTREHPLFPPDDGEDQGPEVCFINVFRREPNGAMTCAPRLFAPEELTSEQDVYNTYGGGYYELVSRAGGSTGRAQISGRRRYQIAGDPRPLTGEARQAPQAAAAPAGPTPMAAAVATQDPMLMMMAFMQQQMQNEQRRADQQMQMMLASQAQQTQVLVAALTGKRDDGSVGAIAQLSQGQNQATMALLGQMLQNQQSAPLDLLRQAIELGQKTAGGAAAAPVEDNSGTEFIAGAMNMIAAMETAKTNGVAIPNPFAPPKQTIDAPAQGQPPQGEPKK